LIGPALVDLTHGDLAAVLTNLAYPLADLLLIALIAGSVVVTGLRGAKPLLLIAAGIFLWAAVDALYLYQVAVGTYVGGLIDTIWPVATFFMVAGAYFGLESRSERVHRPSFVLPGLFTMVAALLLVWDHSYRTNDAAVYLAAATILTCVIRLAISYRDNTRLVRVLDRRSTIDPLTGLANRRRLLEDLESAFTSEKQDPEAQGFLFALFDLNGFKTYNDTFGHPAGDALLRRLGQRLAASVGVHATAYRLGGDEFCALVELRGRAPASVFEIARTALAERGEAFSIEASGGWMALDEAADPTAALRLADQRMYAGKSQHPTRSGDETHAVLKRIFRERERGFSNHIEGVARLAVQAGRALSLEAEDLDVLARAAELHDVGKIAIPDDVLHKPGPLDPVEWDLMRTHTLIGSRILGAAPAMKPVGDLVRSSHERWDGAGYPDRLAGENIPLGARIIAICDAFDAMTGERPYKTPITAQEAVAELRRCAGTQFDPLLVETVCHAIDASRSVGAELGGLEPPTS
jgi:two-component system, cell cycle response regulator